MKKLRRPENYLQYLEKWISIRIAGQLLAMKATEIRKLISVREIRTKFKSGGVIQCLSIDVIKLKKRIKAKITKQLILESQQ
jgi:hypothetical protein